MRPIKVEFQAFGPYEGYESVDFEDLAKNDGRFLICGDTGAGKTTVLDAITYALYGQGSGGTRGEFVNMRCTSVDDDIDTFVKFEFENYGEYFLFERSLIPKRVRINEEYNMSKKDVNGVWQPIEEKITKTIINEKAVEIIGLDFNQFRQVIILPQGQFEKLLTSNSDEKEKILTSIFGEDAWQKYAEIMVRNADNKLNLLKDIKKKIENQLLEEECKDIEELHHKIEEKNNRLTDITQKYEASNCEIIIKEQEDMLRLVDKFKDKKKMENKNNELKEKKPECDKWEEELEEAKKAESLRQPIENENRAKIELERRQNDEEKALEEERNAKDKAERSANELEQHKLQEKAIEKHKEEKTILESKRGVYGELDSDQRKLDAAEKNVRDANEQYDKAKKEHDKAVEDHIGLKEQYDRLLRENKELSDRYFLGIYGEIASKLKDGMECPVCGSKEHPNKAKLSSVHVTREEVDNSKEEMDAKYSEMNAQEIVVQKKESEKKEIDRTRNAAERTLAEIEAQIQEKNNNLAGGIKTADELERKIAEYQKSIDDFNNTIIELDNAQKTSKTRYDEAKTKTSQANEETEKAKKAYIEAKEVVEKALSDNGFKSIEDAKKLMRAQEERDELSRKIAEYNAQCKTTKESLDNILRELEGKVEPDEKDCNKKKQDALNIQQTYWEESSSIKTELNRLKPKYEKLLEDGEGLDDKFSQAENDSNFANRLKGNSGTSLQRYVLGIMFSEVISAANSLLRYVHNGRYQLFRTDDKVTGNKKGLELKVSDTQSQEHEGRSVKTLSGGEKFLVSIALSLGMSSIAQKEGIEIEALFIDEGFGTLDEKSFNNAMEVLDVINNANGMVGIISHVDLLKDAIPTKLIAEEDEYGIHHLTHSIG